MNTAVAQPAAVPMRRAAAHRQPPGWWRFLRRAMAPTPGRSTLMLQIVLAVTIIQIVSMTLRVPEASTSCFLALFMIKENRAVSLLACLLIGVALVSGVAFTLYAYRYTSVDAHSTRPDAPGLLYYRSDPEVAQVVFVATPHRGSSLAGGPWGNLGRFLVRLPLAERTRVGLILSDNRAATAAGVTLKPGSSIDSLTPRDPVVMALNDLPMRPGVGLHSVIGNRGRPGPLARSSDGVVPYTSSHLPQAQSETVVPAGHSGTLRRPETAEAVRRVLRELW